LLVLNHLCQPLGIRSRLLGGFLTVALFTSVLGCYAIATTEQLSRSQRTVYEDVFGGTHLLASWIDQSWETRRDVLAYVLAQDDQEQQALQAKVLRKDELLNDLARQMDAVDVDREDVQTLSRLMDSWRAYTAWRDTAIMGPDAPRDRALLLQEYQSQASTLTDAIDQSIDEFLNQKHAVGGGLERAGEVSYDQARRIAIALAAGAVGMAILVGFILSRRVASAAGQVAAAAQGLARGELNQRIEVTSQDELGQMASAFREMISYQQEMARVAHAIARGDLSQDVEPKSEQDVLGTAFRQMSANLRLLVGQKEAARIRAEELAAAKEEDARTIQKHAAELARLLEVNGQLPKRLRRSAGRTTALNEQALRRLGADLHDGPAQALAFALLRLEGVADERGELARVRSAIQDALNEIRAVSAGLRLPELTDLPITEVLTQAVRDHERRSGTAVALEARDLPIDVPLPVKIAAFRALQEALSNATRHGGGADVSVKACVCREQLCLTVSDRGPGFAPKQAEHKGRLGLASMRERAELLGGRFRVQSSSRGTAVHLRWPLVGLEPRVASLPLLMLGALDEADERAELTLAS
jgi:signal transduction histidine kinase